MKSLWTSDLNLDPCSQERDEHKNLGNTAHRAVAVAGHISHRAQGGDCRAYFCFECLDLMSAKSEVLRFILDCTHRVLQIINDIRVIV